MPLNIHHVRTRYKTKPVPKAQSGGEAKHLIQAGHVRVNDEVELRRGRKLWAGDRVTFANQTYDVISDVDSIDNLNQ